MRHGGSATSDLSRLVGPGCGVDRGDAIYSDCGRTVVVVVAAAAAVAAAATAAAVCQENVITGSRPCEEAATSTSPQVFLSMWIWPDLALTGNVW